MTSLAAETIDSTLGYRPLISRQAVDWARTGALFATKNRIVYFVGALFTGLLSGRTHGELAKEIM